MPASSSSEKRANQSTLGAVPAWVDVTVPLKDGMVHWPSNPAVEIKRSSDLDCGGRSNVSSLHLGSHTGTHMDAPLHFIKNGASLDQMPPETTIGLAKVIEIKDSKAIDVEEISRHEINEADRILFKTRNSLRCWDTNEFVKDYIYLTRDAASFLAEKNVQLLGIDYLSIGEYQGQGHQTHRILLEKGIWVIEGLDLRQVSEGNYEMIALPLKIADSDGAPCRVLLRSLTSGEIH
jgi:arylformamidase